MLVAQVHRSDIAVCGGDVSLPRSIQKRKQKDKETRLTWHLKDEVMRRGRVNSRETRGRSFDVCRAALDKPFCRHLEATAERRAAGFVRRSPVDVNEPVATPSGDVGKMNSV